MLDGASPYTFVGEDGKAITRDQAAISEVLAAKALTLCPAYDYRERIKEIPIVRDGKMVQDPQAPGVPAMQPMRTPLVMPVGFTLEPHPVHVPGLCYGTQFRFLSQMDQRDATTQRNFAKETRDMMKSMRMQASNLQMPTADDVVRAARSKA